jgi:VCBS repeat-containing protein
MPTDANGHDGIDVTDLSQLSSVLVGTVIAPTTVTGNLITGSVPPGSFGADGPAALKIVSIAHDTDGNGVIDSNEVYNTSSTGYNAATTTLTITTHDGGTLAVNFSTGNYTYTNSTAQPVNTDTSEVFKYTVMDHDGDTAAANLTITIHGESAPTAGAQSVIAEAGSGVGTNLLLMIDTTGSMSDSSGVKDAQGNVMSKLALEKAALDQLITEYGTHGDVMVRLVTFHDGTSEIVGNGWMTASQAIATINALTNSGNTNYDAALLNAQTAFNTTGAIAFVQIVW